MKLKTLFAPSDMTSGRPWEKIVIFTVPMLIGNIAQQLYNTRWQPWEAQTRF